VKDDSLGLLIGGAVVLYLIMNRQGVSAAQAQITQTQLTAGTNVANAQLIANAAQNVNTDLSLIGSFW
jgi:hypothetical protein